MKLYYDSDGAPTWIEVVDIITFPVPRIRMDEPSQIVVELRDFEGALYTTWNSRDFTEMKVTDGAGTPTTLFRGFISGKKFLHKKTTITIDGFSKKLESKPFHKNYILQEGKISLCPGGAASGDILNLLPIGNGTIQLHKNPVETEDWENIDEVDGGENTVDYIFADETDDGQYSAFVLENDDGLLVDEVTDVLIRSYARNNAALGNDQPAYVSISWNNGVDWEVDKTLNLQTTYAWRQSAYGGLSKTRADLNNMQVRFKAKAALGAGEQQYCAALYVRVIYNGFNENSVDITNDDDEAFDDSPDADYWINDQNVGLLIVDSTENIESKTWQCSAIDMANGVELDAGANPLDYRNDGDTYEAKDTTTPWDMVIDLTINGAGFDEGLKLNRIEIDWRFGIKTEEIPGYHTEMVWELQISVDGTNWDNIGEYRSNYRKTWYRWIEGTEVLQGTNAFLASYLSKTGTDYTHFKYIRMKMSGGYDDKDGFVKLDEAVIRVYYYASTVAPVMDKIVDSFGDGTDSWVKVDSIVLKDHGVAAGDYFKIGQNTTQVIDDIAAKSGISIYCQSTLTKYIAQFFKGSFSIEILKQVCLLEGLHWWEDHQNYVIVISKETDFVDSTVDLTQADYLWEWEFEDDSNQYKTVEVYGSAALRIYYKATDPDTDNTSPLVKSIIEETILTIPEAKEIAETQLAELKIKRKSIRIPLNGVQAKLGVGKTVTLTMVRPTVAAADYPIRMIERYKVGISGIKTIIYCGLGHSTWEENMADLINKAMYLAHKAHTNRLISMAPTEGGISFTWADIGGAQAAVESIIDAEIADVFALLGIGIGNKRWKNCILEGGSHSFTHFKVGDSISNLGGDNIILVFGVPLDLIIADKNLIITDTKIGVAGATGADYIDRYRLFGWSDHDSDVALVDDGTNLIAAQEKTYGHANQTIGGIYERALLYFNCVNTNANDLKISFVKVEYYYV